MSAATASRVTARDIEMLKSVAAGDVTFRQEYRRKGTITSYRLWSSEHDYEVVTRRVSRLVGARLAKVWHGWQLGAGGVDITPEGRAVLNPESGGRGDTAE